MVMITEGPYTGREIIITVKEVDNAALLYGQMPTIRELEALAMSAKVGCRLASKQMGITEQTVKNHLWNVYRKLDVRSHAEAVIVAFSLGLISAEMKVVIEKDGPPRFAEGKTGQLPRKKGTTRRYFR